MKCTWCGNERKSMSEWEQKNYKGEWKPICKPCTTQRLHNPMNALLNMRKITGDIK